MTPDQLKAAMTELGLSTAALARLLEVDQTTIWRWRTGKSPMPKMAELLIRAALSA